VRDAAGRLKSLFGTVQDITERKQAEQLFAAHHAVTTLLAEAPALQEGVPRILEVICERLGWDLGTLWQLDTQGDALRCAARWLGSSACGSAYAAAIRDRKFDLDDELIGGIWAKREPAFISDIALGAKSERAQLATSDGLHATFGFPVLVGSNVWGVMEFFSQEVRQPEQDLLTTMATLASQIGQFVERKEAETALRDARDQLAHVTRIASLGEMTASIAHEVNQPLTGIIANAHAALQWLSREPPELQEATDCIQRLVRDGRRAGNVVAGLRNLIRRGDKTCKVSVDLNQLVRETIPLVRGEIQRIEATLELDLCPELAPVLGDRVQVQQLLLNLIVNAVESMSTPRAKPARLTIRSWDEGDLVGVSVHDTGIGLRTEDIGRIFDAFFTTKPQGLGMGLAISRSIVEDHGGRLSASSRLGDGSIFQFTLRKAPPQP
jgi:signal transduction histidine kinase